MKSLLSISVAILLLASCKKTTVDQPAQTVTTSVIPKIKTLTVSNPTTTLGAVSYEYDNAGRITKLINNDGSNIKYAYTVNSVKTESFTGAGISDGKTTYTLNAAGLAATFFRDAAPSTITYFTYNTAKQLIKEITDNGVEITFQQFHTYDAEGNKIADSIVDGQISKTRKITYYTDKVSTFEGPNQGVNIFGTPVKNCPKQSSLKVSTSSFIITDFSSPEIDALGRVTKSTYTTQGVTYTYLYTYY